jgi:alpha-galactosidase
MSGLIVGIIGMMTWPVFGQRADLDQNPQPDGKKPLQIYILAGQSNMEGPAFIHTIDYIGDDPATAPMLAEMRGPDGKPRVCNNVWISYLTGKPFGDVVLGEGFGKLTTGYGARYHPALPGEKIGPEFTFGIYMSKAVKEPILIIKAAWGGKSLNTDFRPPSAGPYVPTQSAINQKKFVTTAQRQKKIEETGFYYRAMIDHARRVLHDIKRVYPGYDAQQGYEVAGFVWLQGWNDMTDHDTYPTPSGQTVPDYYQYTEWLGDFIRDVRRDLKAPQMPFVIGVLGCDGFHASDGTKAFRKAMAATADIPEFKGNVAAVQTAPFWDERLGAIYLKRQKLWQEGILLNKRVKSGAIIQEEADRQLQKLRDELISPAEDALWKRGASDGNYHYLGCAKTFALMGKKFAETLLELQKEKNATEQVR